MNTNKILPDDPRLTAYALNEMEPAERTEFEQVLAQDTAAQQAVSEIRATVADLRGALEHEPMVEWVAPEAKKPGLLLRFPQFYYVVSGLAAACFALFFVYSQQHQKDHRPRSYVEVNLPNADAEKKEKAGAMVELPVAQVAADAPPPAPVTVAVAPMETDEKATLSPSVATESRAVGYVANSAMAPARRETSFKDIGGMALMAKQSARDEGARARTTPEPLRYAAGKTRDTLGPVNGNTEAYAYRQDNAFLRVADQPLSTFAADVDTASYSNVRRFLLEGQRPPADAVRIEELVNYFPYNYAGPNLPESRGDVTGPLFAAHLEVAGAPWTPEHRLVRIGLKGRELSDAARPAANLVFLLDVSGSMNEPNKLPLVQQSLRLLVQKLRPDDRVAIAVYAGASGLALPSTTVAHKAEILDAIDRLQAEGSTNGAAGIQLAYDIAKANFITGGVNRVILATDGDFNVGVTSEGGLLRLVEEKAKSGVFLTVLGFGMGNYKDATLEQLADKGNGNYAYIDSLAEAKKALVEQAGGTLVTIAKDVKLQVEFNPTVVQAYRLIGYENRLLAKEDFNNDKIDAGEIGAGHTVTALYEVVPVGVAMPGETRAVDQLKYQVVSGQRSAVSGEQTKPEGGKLTAEGGSSPEMLTVKVRYKDPAGDVSRKVEFTLHDSGAAFADASQDFKFAAAVAAFGMELRGSPYKGKLTLADVAAWGRDGIGSDPGGYRTEFIGLVEKAEKLVQ